MLRPIALLIYIFCFLGTAHASDSKEILERFQVLPEPPCQKSSLREPRDVDTVFFSERHYLSIDGGKECQIFDVWVGPLTKSPYENRRYMESVIYRRSGNVWVKEYGLSYVPKFRLMDRKTGKVYFYVYLDESPFYKDEIVYFGGKWDGDKKDKAHFGNIRSLGDCADENQRDCIEEAKLVRRAVDLFKQK